MSPALVIFLLTPPVLWVAVMAHTVEAAGFRFDAEEVAPKIGTLPPDGRTVALFADPIGLRAKRRIRLFEYRGGQVSIQRLDGTDHVMGVLGSSEIRYRIFTRLVKVSVSSVVNGRAVTYSYRGHAMPKESRALENLGR